MYVLDYVQKLSSDINSERGFLWESDDVISVFDMDTLLSNIYPCQLKTVGNCGEQFIQKSQVEITLKFMS